MSLPMTCHGKESHITIEAQGGNAVITSYLLCITHISCAVLYFFLRFICMLSPHNTLSQSQLSKRPSTLRHKPALRSLIIHLIAHSDRISYRKSTSSDHLAVYAFLLHSQHGEKRQKEPNQNSRKQKPFMQTLCVVP
jgi:hypothetical protein